MSILIELIKSVKTTNDLENISRFFESKNIQKQVINEEFFYYVLSIIVNRTETPEDIKIRIEAVLEIFHYLQTNLTVDEWLKYKNDVGELILEVLNALHTLITFDEEDYYAFGYHVTSEVVVEFYYLEDEVINTFIVYIFGKIVEIIVNSDLNIDFRKLLAKKLITLVCRMSYSVRRDFYNDNLMIINKIVKVLLYSGDFDFQLALLELLFRLNPSHNSENTLNQWITLPKLKDFKNEYLQFNLADYDTSSRKLLNKLNEALGLVFSIVCESGSLGIFNLYKSKNTEDKFWVDFNMETRCIFLICDEQSFNTSETPSISSSSQSWVTITATSKNIAKITIKWWRISGEDKPCGKQVTIKGNSNFRIDSLKFPVPELSLALYFKLSPELTNLENNILPKMNFPILVNKTASRIIKADVSKSLLDKPPEAISSPSEPFEQLKEKLLSHPKAKYSKRFSVSESPQLSNIPEETPEKLSLQFRATSLKSDNLIAINKNVDCIEMYDASTRSPVLTSNLAHNARDITFCNEKNGLFDDESDIFRDEPEESTVMCGQDTFSDSIIENAKLSREDFFCPEETVFIEELDVSVLNSPTNSPVQKSSKVKQYKNRNARVCSTTVVKNNAETNVTSLLHKSNSANIDLEMNTEDKRVKETKRRISTSVDINANNAKPKCKNKIRTKQDAINVPVIPSKYLTENNSDNRAYSADITLESLKTFNAENADTPNITNRKLKQIPKYVSDSNVTIRKLKHSIDIGVVKNDFSPKESIPQTCDESRVKLHSRKMRKSSTETKLWIDQTVDYLSSEKNRITPEEKIMQDFKNVDETISPKPLRETRTVSSSFEVHSRPEKVVKLSNVEDEEQITLKEKVNIPSGKSKTDNKNIKNTDSSKREEICEPGLIDLKHKSSTSDSKVQNASKKSNNVKTNSKINSNTEPKTMRLRSFLDRTESTVTFQKSDKSAKKKSEQKVTKMQKLNISREENKKIFDSSKTVTESSDRFEEHKNSECNERHCHDNLNDISDLNIKSAKIVDKQLVTKLNTFDNNESLNNLTIFTSEAESEITKNIDLKISSFSEISSPSVKKSEKVNKPEILKTPSKGLNSNQNEIKLVSGSNKKLGDSQNSNKNITSQTPDMCRTVQSLSNQSSLIVQKPFKRLLKLSSSSEDSDDERDVNSLNMSRRSSELNVSPLNSSLKLHRSATKPEEKSKFAKDKSPIKSTKKQDTVAASKSLQKSEEYSNQSIRSSNLNVSSLTSDSELDRSNIKSSPPVKSTKEKSKSDKQRAQKNDEFTINTLIQSARSSELIASESNSDSMTGTKSPIKSTKKQETIASSRILESKRLQNSEEYSDQSIRSSNLNVSSLMSDAELDRSTIKSPPPLKSTKEKSKSDKQCTQKNDEFTINTLIQSARSSELIASESNSDSTEETNSPIKSTKKQNTIASSRILESKRLQNSEEYSNQSIRSSNLNVSSLMSDSDLDRSNIKSTQEKSKSDRQRAQSAADYGSEVAISNSVQSTKTSELNVCESDSDSKWQRFIGDTKRDTVAATTKKRSTKRLYSATDDIADTWSVSNESGATLNKVVKVTEPINQFKTCTKSTKKSHDHGDTDINYNYNRIKVPKYEDSNRNVNFSYRNFDRRSYLKRLEERSTYDHVDSTDSDTKLAIEQVNATVPILKKRLQKLKQLNGGYIGTQKKKKSNRFPQLNIRITSLLKRKYESTRSYENDRNAYKISETSSESETENPSRKLCAKKIKSL